MGWFREILARRQGSLSQSNECINDINVLKMGARQYCLTLLNTENKAVHDQPEIMDPLTVNIAEQTSFYTFFFKIRFYLVI